MLLGDGDYHLPRRAAYVIFLFVLLTYLSDPLSATPLPNATEDYQTQVHQNSTSEPFENSTSNDLYIIRAVVYEIGILTDMDNTTNDSSERHEEVNIAIYDPPHKDNGELDLSNISKPEPVTSDFQDAASESEH